jgi:hypothetical protein
MQGDVSLGKPRSLNCHVGSICDVLRIEPVTEQGVTDG